MHITYSTNPFTIRDNNIYDTAFANAKRQYTIQWKQTAFRWLPLLITLETAELDIKKVHQ